MKRCLPLISLFIPVAVLAQDYKAFPMWNHNLPIDQRVNDVVSRLTLEEKVGQLLNATPAISRLGIPAYDWWNEVLHGVARTPYKTTSYPQAIGMAATWDTNSLHLMADQSAIEGRAIHNKAIELGRTDFNALANRIKDVDVIIYVGGISPELEGEEMKVNYPGFKGGDRTSILLPAVQTELMKALKSTGKPVVFVMMTGSAIATPWESGNIPAIINAWYGGQSAGEAIADVLFGDYNPAGRLPVTFYKSDSDLPSFNDYAMSNRTYRYFKGEPLYPFGYGLSYSDFTYNQLTTPASIKKKQSLTISVRVTNKSKTNGEEVAQLYLSYKNKESRLPRLALKGFQRFNLKAGESKLISFTLSPEQLSVVDHDGMPYQPAGPLMISVGGGQPGVKNKTSSNVVQKEILIK